MNVDNSPSVSLSRLPVLALRILQRLGFLDAAQLQVIYAARRFGIRRASATDLPFDEATIDVIYSSHMLEHLDREQAKRFLAEAHRVLRPRGWIRIVVPDLQRHIRAYQEEGDADALMHDLRLAWPRERGRKRLLQQAVGFRGHRWMYDSVSLVRLLESSGFSNAIVLDPGETGIPNVRGLNLREREGESIYCEARKP